MKTEGGLSGGWAVSKVSPPKNHLGVHLGAHGKPAVAFDFVGFGDEVGGPLGGEVVLTVGGGRERGLRGEGATFPVMRGVGEGVDCAECVPLWVGVVAMEGVPRKGVIEALELCVGALLI